MSGLVLNKTQCTASPLTAMDDWVRANAFMLPWRKPWHIRQLQFHCGKPPPAADPNTLSFT
jgi:hypothetical protein